ncbi:MAG: hypothetical protein R2856_05495 [Caldilineaceae bacterium]
MSGSLRRTPQIGDHRSIDAAAHLAARYVPDRFMPDKAIDLIDEAYSRVRACTKRSHASLRETFISLKKLQKRRKKRWRRNASTTPSTALP